MSLDKAIEHKKEFRKKYYGCKAWDPAARNHGSDEYMNNNRLFQYNREKDRADTEIRNYLKALLN